VKLNKLKEDGNIIENNNNLCSIDLFI